MSELKPLTLCETNKVANPIGMTCYVYAFATFMGLDFPTAFHALNGQTVEDFLDEKRGNYASAAMSVEAFEKRIALLGIKRVSRNGYKRAPRHALLVATYHPGYHVQTLHTVAWCGVTKQRLDCAGYDSIGTKKNTILRAYALVGEPKTTIAELTKDTPARPFLNRMREQRELRTNVMSERQNLTWREEDRAEAEQRRAERAERQRWAALREEADRRAGESSRPAWNIDAESGEEVIYSDTDSVFQDAPNAEAMSRLMAAFPGAVVNQPVIPQTVMRNLTPSYVNPAYVEALRNSVRPGPSPFSRLDYNLEARLGA